jgi:peptide/nickel transport system substrate-binding protein
MKRTTIVCSVLFLVISLILCSCTAPSSTTAVASTTITRSSGTITTPLPAKVTVAFSGTPSTMDITNGKISNVTDIPVLENIYEPFAGYSYEGVSDPSAGLASWTVSEEGKVYTFTLRKGVKFHSGDPLTTADVIFSHDRVMKNHVIYPNLYKDLVKIDVVDDYTLVMTFSKPNVMLLTSPRLYIVSKAYYDRVGEEEFVNHPIGTGPYKFVEWKRGEYLDLVSNEGYWGEKPQIKEARILFAAEETTRVAMLQAGEVEVITSTPMNMVDTLTKAGFTSVNKAAVPDYALKFQTKNPNVPWYDKNVRKAIAYAIDRESIVKNIYYGLPQINAWLAPWQLGYDDSIKPYTYDIAKAKQLLAEAGYPNGFEMPVYYDTDTVGVKDLVEAVSLYLKAVDITCKPTGMTVPQIRESQTKTANDTTAVVTYLGGCGLANYPETVSCLGFFLSRTANALYNTPKLDVIIDNAMSTFDNTARGELIKQAFRIINEDEPQVQILSTVSIFTSRSNIKIKPTKITNAFLLVKDIKFK